MKHFLTLVSAAQLCAGLMLAQSSTSSIASQSWTGLLVASGCQDSRTTTDLGRSAVTENGMAKTSPGSKTERNSTYEQTLNHVNSSNRATQTGDHWMDAEKTAGSMDKSCQIGAQTVAFALRLPDGRMIPLDDAGNGKIANQIQSTKRLGEKAKIFRVVVKGTLQDDRISVDSLKM